MGMETILKLWEQMIDRVMFLHFRGIIHRDIKPQNFLVGTHPDKNLYIIDFGLSKRYLHAATGNHIPMRKWNDFVGTSPFISETVHSGWEPCRRDDLISVGYVALMLLLGQLPWQTLREHKSYMCKKATTNKDLCKGLPNNFVKYFDYLCSLAYDATPDYNYLKKLIRSSCNALSEGPAVHEETKSRHKKHIWAGKKPSRAKNSHANGVSCKAVWDEIGSAAARKITSIKKRFPAMLAHLLH